MSCRVYVYLGSFIKLFISYIRPMNMHVSDVMTVMKRVEYLPTLRCYYSADLAGFADDLANMHQP